MSIVGLKVLRCLHVVMVCFLVSGLQTARAQPLTTVTGVVLDGVTNAPIANVDVVSGQRTVVTGSDGRFSIAVDTETSELRFMADGYLDSVAPLVGGDLEVRLFSSRFAETVEVEHLLGNHQASHQEGEFDPDDGDDGKQGVFQSMAVYDDLLQQSLGSSSADIILPQYLQHR